MEIVSDANRQKFIDGCIDAYHDEAERLESDAEDNGHMFVRLLALGALLFVGLSFGFIWGRYWR